MNAKTLLIALTALSLIVLPACGLLPGTGAAPTKQAGAPAPAQTTQPGAPAPAQTTQPGAPAPAVTTDSGALPSAPRTPTATPPPSVCENYDDFTNKSFDGTINGDLWPKAESGQAVYVRISQHDGFMEVSNDSATGQNRIDQTFTLRRPGPRPVEQLTCFEAKLRLGGSAHKAGFPSVKLHIVSEQNEVTECRLASPQPGGPVQYRCEFVGKYSTPFVAAKYDTWHKARIEVRPHIDSKELLFNYYLDDALIGSYNTGTSQIYNSKLTPSIVVQYSSADTVAATYFDDVKVTAAK